MNHPKVSVSLITYNHEKYIGECLDSILKQKTNFDFEIVVSDDCSTDKTGAIVEEYAAKHPDVIRHVKRVNNLGMVQNAISTIAECKGEYVALMEGDDLWIDSNKLQLQADFLDNNPDCVLCFTNQFEFFEDSEKDTDKMLYHAGNKPPDKFDLDYFFKNNPIIPNNSKMFRKSAQPSEFPDGYFKSLQWDWVLHVLQTKNGQFAYLDYVTLGFRRHRHAASMSTNYTELAISGLITLKYLNKYLNYKYDFFCSQTSWHYNLLAFSYLEKKKIIRFFYYYLAYLVNMKSLNELTLRNDAWRWKQIITGREWK